MAVKANDISVDGYTLALACVKAIADGKGLKDVAEQTGLKYGTISQRLKVIRKNYPQLAPSLEFPKGVKGGKGGSKKTKIDENQLSELQAVVAQLTGAPPSTVIENGMSMIRKEDSVQENPELVAPLKA